MSGSRNGDDGDEPPLFVPGEELVACHPWLRGALLNLDGDYRYLGDGYYRSLEAELAGAAVHPTTAEVLDAYVVPLSLTKGRAAGLPVAEARLVVDGAPVPSLLYPINPFSRRPTRVDDDTTLHATLGAATRVGKYLALCQPLGAGERLEALPCLLGRSPNGEHGELARKLFDVFRLPLLRAQLLVTDGEPPRLSSLDPLPWRELGADERALIEELGSWRI